MSGGARAWCSALFLASLGVAGTTLVDAHGGKQRLVLAPAGPYLVSAWTAPDPARVGRLDVSVAVLGRETREPEPNATVRISARRAGAVVSAPAVLDPGGVLGLFSTPLFHATIGLGAEGVWQVAVFIEGPAGSGPAGSGPAGAGGVAFDIDVVPAPPIRWTVLMVGVAIPLVALVIWRLRRRPPPAAPTGVLV